MCKCFCNPLGDLTAIVLELKDNFQQVARDEKTMSQALKDTGKFIMGLSMIVK